MAVGSWRNIHPHGVSKLRYPCFLEGRGKHILWLSEAELRGGWRHWRPEIDPTPIPAWLFRHHDVTYGVCESFWLSRQEIKRGWIRLTGMMAPPFRLRTVLEKDDTGQEVGIVQPFVWGIQRYDTFFVPLSEALHELRPRFGVLNAWDRVDSGGPV